MISNNIDIDKGKYTAIGRALLIIIINDCPKKPTTNSSQPLQDVHGVFFRIDNTQ